jgi:DNA-nicking Smr family endonuclease
MTRRPRQLSEADRELWARVAASLRPIGPPAAAGARPVPGQAAPAPPTVALAPPRFSPPEPDRPPAPIRDGLRGLDLPGRTEPPVRWSVTGAERPRPPGPSTPGLDRGTARRLARGQREPEARLDLHGMTADRAHAALTRFVAEALHSGLRCVLVVTGMGRGEDGRQRGDGVLRRETPRWLSVPPLSGHVVGVFEAHPRHGGAGALYVYLRRSR